METRTLWCCACNHRQMNYETFWLPGCVLQSFVLFPTNSQMGTWSSLPALFCCVKVQILWAIRFSRTHWSGPRSSWLDQFLMDKIPDIEKSAVWDNCFDFAIHSCCLPSCTEHRFLKQLCFSNCRKAEVFLVFTISFPIRSSGQGVTFTPLVLTYVLL